MSVRCVVVVTRAPGNDLAKTRLAAGIGAAACARLRDAFIGDTLAWASELAALRVLSVHPPESASRLEPLAPGWAVVGQPEPSFGARMRGAVNAGFAAGGSPVAMIATDSPTLPVAHVTAAWRRLERGASDAVLGPADDGGWVLIAARAPLPERCFDGVRWSGPDACADTEAALRRCGLRVARGERWYDVDVPEDLERLRRHVDPQREPRTAAALVDVVDLRPAAS